MTPELISNGTNVYQMTRKELPPVEPKRRDLTEAQLAWLAERHPGIFRNRFESRK